MACYEKLKPDRLTNYFLAVDNEKEKEYHERHGRKEEKI